MYLISTRNNPLQRRSVEWRLQSLISLTPKLPGGKKRDYDLIIRHFIHPLLCTANGRNHLQVEEILWVHIMVGRHQNFRVCGVTSLQAAVVLEFQGHMIWSRKASGGMSLSSTNPSPSFSNFTWRR